MKNFMKKLLLKSKKELINLVKSQNLIDIRTPSFLNAKLDLNKKSNLVELNSRIKKIDSIENIYVQEFNKELYEFKNKIFRKIRKDNKSIKKENIIYN